MLIKYILFIERFTIVSLTISMVGLYGLNVIVREVVPQYASLFAWIDEASRILMVWVVFLSIGLAFDKGCLLYTNPSPRDSGKSRMTSSA